MKMERGRVAMMSSILSNRHFLTVDNLIELGLTYYKIKKWLKKARWSR